VTSDTSEVLKDDLIISCVGTDARTLGHRPQSPPRLHLVFSECKFGIVRGVWRSHVLIVRMVFWTMVVGTRFKLGQRGARVGRERRGGLSRDLTTIFGMYAAFCLVSHPRSFDPSYGVTRVAAVGAW